MWFYKCRYNEGTERVNLIRGCWLALFFSCSPVFGGRPGIKHTVAIQKYTRAKLLWHWMSWILWNFALAMLNVFETINLNWNNFFYLLMSKNKKIANLIDMFMIIKQLHLKKSFTSHSSAEKLLNSCMFLRTLLKRIFQRWIKQDIWWVI